MIDDQLESKTGHAETATGQSLSIPEALRIADQAQIVPTVLSGRGQPLWLGRTRRLASQAQTCALIARDGGCSFPGCSTRPQWCDRHHIIDWLSGGLTDINNLTLLCRYHHTHYAAAGWTCRITPDGLPAWAPPKWRDPQQHFLINHRIRERHRTRE